MQSVLIDLLWAFSGFVLTTVESHLFVKWDLWDRLSTLLFRSVSTYHWPICVGCCANKVSVSNYVFRWCSFPKRKHLSSPPQKCKQMIYFSICSQTVVDSALMLWCSEALPSLWVWRRLWCVVLCEWCFEIKLEQPELQDWNSSAELWLEFQTASECDSHLILQRSHFTQFSMFILSKNLSGSSL